MDTWVIKGKALSNRGIKRIRAAIWLLQMLILVGYLMILVIKPTSTYWLNWLNKIRATADSTYFGEQGSVLLIDTFPVLLLAVLGCVYLHLGTKLNVQNLGSKRKRHNLSLIRRPVLVEGPLGIVSGVELSVFIMFMALLVWSFSCYLHVSFDKFINPQSVAKEESVWEAKLGWASLWLGALGNICLVFLFFPVTRASPVLPLFGLTSEGSIKYHIWLGHITMVLFTAHGIGYIFKWGATHRLDKVLKWANTGVSNVAGEISLVAGLVLWATTFPRIRHRFFELFFYTHYLYIPFIIFFVFHLGIDYSSTMLPGFYLFLLDRYLRFLQSQRSVRLLSARVLPCETVELNFSKSTDMKYTPTSIVFINVPSISKLQWHPYTINSSSTSDTEQLSVVVKTEGSWSHKLYQILSSSPDRLPISIEGPYGPVSTQFLRHDALVMVSGGSGITPFISIIRELTFSTSITPPKLLLICAFKDSKGLTMLDLLLPVSGNHSIISGDQLQIEAYVTREKQPIAEEDPKLIRTVWLKPHGSDEAISNVLGPNGWLWLGTIVACSFILYLILMGVLTRFYIFPIDHNSFKVYPMAATAALHMTLICICIVAVATGAVLRNKKQHQEVGRETAPPLCTDEKELESLPSRSLVGCTKVYYGGRPNMKRIFEGCKGGSVGVMVCGPRKMRHEVASICSSPSSNNLHFESISFSW